VSIHQRTFLVATTNDGKVREIRQVLAGLPITIKTLKDFPRVAEPEETASTFAGNALLKAEYYATACACPTVAEDSGLAIDALGGRPGVESARYPGASFVSAVTREGIPELRDAALARLAEESRPARRVNGEGPES